MERNGLVVGVLGLTCTVAACSKEPLVGEWELSSLTAQAYPAYSFYDEYCGYAEVSYSAVTQGRGSMRVDETLGVRLDLSFDVPYSISSEYCETVTATDSLSFSGSGNARAFGNGTYDISVRDDAELALDCRLAEDFLDCDVDGGTRIGFRRR